MFAHECTKMRVQLCACQSSDSRCVCACIFVGVLETVVVIIIIFAVVVVVVVVFSVVVIRRENRKEEEMNLIRRCKALSAHMKWVSYKLISSECHRSFCVCRYYCTQPSVHAK